MMWDFGQGHEQEARVQSPYPVPQHSQVCRPGPRRTSFPYANEPIIANPGFASAPVQYSPPVQDYYQAGYSAPYSSPYSYPNVNSSPGFIPPTGSYPPAPISSGYPPAPAPYPQYSAYPPVYNTPRDPGFFVDTSSPSPHYHHHHHHHSHHYHSPTQPPRRNSDPIVVNNATTYVPPIIPDSHHKLHKPPPNKTKKVKYQLVTEPAGSELNPAFQYSRCTGTKRALCIGVNYTGQNHELRGCVNDARTLRKALISQFGYPRDSVMILSDGSPGSTNLPTRKNIVAAMKWLVKDAKENDSLFFHYSGHGGQTPDKDGDEIDGYDEVIYPLDYQKNGHITDDEMHEIMVKHLPTGCRLTALFDSCHSGTVLDLPYIYSDSGRLKGLYLRRRALKARETTADVISWSGCKDNQKSADTFAGGVAVGAMSHAFIASLRDNPRQSYQELLKSVRKLLVAYDNQTPQLGSSHRINTSLRFVI